MASFDDFKTKRDVIWNRIKILQKYIEAQTAASIDQIELQVKQQRFQDISVEYARVQDEMDLLCADTAALQIELTNRTKIEEFIDGTVISFKRLIKQPTMSPSAPPSEIRLPRIELPTFDGSIEGWASFRDIFSAAVHNTSLQKSQKLTYLKSKLTGEAARLVKSFELTNANYDTAWAMLNSRYDNNRELLFSILRRFVGQPVLMGNSATSLRSLIDVSNECVQSLKGLKVNVEHWDAIIMFHMFQKLDQSSKELWEQKLPDSSIPSLKEFLDFLEQRARGIAASATTISNKNQGAKGDQSQNKRQNVYLADSSYSCSSCQGDHPIFKCSQFKGLTISERFDHAKKSCLCYNCLRGGHSSSKCNSTHKCQTCKGNHHTMLHFEKSETSTTDNNEQSSNSAESFNAIEDSKTPQSILATARVKVLNSKGGFQIFRAMLDGGSTCSFITEDAFRQLGLKRCPSNTKIVGIASTPAGRTKGVTSLTVSPHFASIDEPHNVHCLILPRVTGRLPSHSLDPTQWPHLHGLLLADPKYHKPAAIDILLGSDFFWQSIQDGKRHGPDNSPVGIKSSLGWLVAGRVDSYSSTVNSNISNLDLDNRLKMFWELDAISTNRAFTTEELNCENHFEITHSRTIDGRFVVKLPFKNPQPVLGTSRDLALRRLKSLERRLSQTSEYHEQYKKFMNEYLELGHMEAIPSNEVLQPLNPSCYIPHHFVLKQSSTTTKFRVVFDASMQTSNGTSLNQTLMVGPTIQDPLINILMRFRKHPIAFTSDVQKMYRQVKVTAPDADMQRIVWRDDSSKPIVDYRLVTVAYGTASAPYLATKALQQLAHDEQESFPLAAAEALYNFYVDDLMSGASTLDQASRIQKELQQMMAKGKFELRKWCSNSQELMDTIPPEYRETKFFMPLNLDENVKALGIIWIMTTDQFMFKLNLDITSREYQLTKRKLLSELAKIYDPLGWLAPVIIRGKILLQELWKLELGWDDTLPIKIQSHWYEFRDNLIHLEQIRIPRCLMPSTYVETHLFGFADASEKAYAAVTYTGVYFSNRNPVVTLVSSKTRVAPVKTISIPRLELCGAVLLAKLMKNTEMALKVKFNSIRCWTDSTVVLAWISNHPSKWKTFVANRVTEVQNMYPANLWGHVSGVNNPADCASRGLTPSDLKEHSLWWNGPEWLQSRSPPLSEQNTDWSIIGIEEKAVQPISMAITIEDNELWSRYSSFRKLKRITAWINRFIENCEINVMQRKAVPTMKLGGPLTVCELINATHILVRKAQQDVFHDEIQRLTNKQVLPRKCKILPLTPFLDPFQVMRVGGRLRHARIPLDQKNPMLLPRHHPLTEMIILQYHLDHFHAGPQLLLSLLQQQFWIPCGRDAVRFKVKKCVICARHAPNMLHNLMGDLPEARINPARPFLRCGVDYAGPFLIKPIAPRSKITLKAYLCLFVCFVTHAVHLEVVTSLSTDAFLAAMKRFISRRGRPSNMYSDCGTNFVGAAREIKETIAFLNGQSHNEQLTNEMSKSGITWHFNPPGAPHFGGLWEAGVKSVKFHLHRIIGTTRLNFEELTTVMSQIEAILNSRPLIPASTDPNELRALTPGHFLIGTTLLACPERDIMDIKTNLLSRWQLMQQLQQLFWRRWSSEYISRLQHRPKWLQVRNEVRLGDMVIIKDDRYPPLEWKLGRVLAIHPGDDNITRVVTLRTANGDIDRPIVKVCLLPIDQKLGK